MSYESLEFSDATEEEQLSEYIAKGKRLVETFSWDDYVAYVPEEIIDELYTILTAQQRGWLQKLRILYKLKFHTEQVDLNRNRLLRSMNPKAPGRKIKAVDPIEAFKASLMLMDEKNLRKHALMYNVSYNSYMNSGDKPGLVEAIAEEYSTQE